MTEDRDAEKRAPRRTLNKQEAIRHLIHAAIRLIMKMEDPFAIHVLVHSADKMLIDMASKLGKELRVDWEDYIKPEYQKQFFERHRATYNYFKHADKDFADDLPVHDIMMLNVMALFMCMANYVKLFAEYTEHMMLFQMFVINLSPAIVSVPQPQRSELIKGLVAMQTMTPDRYFKTFEENSHLLPKFCAEEAKDLEDIIDFYHLSFSELRAGVTESPRRFRLPDY